MTETIYQQATTAMQSANHLKLWLQETGRLWMVLNTRELVDALPWPEGVEALLHIIEAYRQHRLTIPVEHIACPKINFHQKGKICVFCRNSGTVVSRSKDDVLELDEMKDAVTWLLNQILEKDPSWNPFTAP